MRQQPAELPVGALLPTVRKRGKPTALASPALEGEPALCERGLEEREAIRARGEVRGIDFPDGPLDSLRIPELAEALGTGGTRRRR